MNGETSAPVGPIPHAEPVKPKRGCGFWLLLVLTIFFFGCTLILLAFVCTLIGGLSESTLMTADEPTRPRKLSEVVVEGRGKDKIVLITVRGLITNDPERELFYTVPSMVDMIKRQLDEAGKDSDVKAVLFEVDSPGGGITASDVLYHRIARFKKETGRKVVVLMTDLGASGAYYMAVPADRIVAHPTSITGSIGVIMPLLNFTELASKVGIKSQPIKSGAMKDMGSPMRDMSKEEEKVLNGIIQEMYGRFVNIVATERKLPVERVRQLADGRVFTGEQAHKEGLVDMLGYMEDAVAEAKRLAEVKDARVIRYQRSLSFSDFLHAAAARLMARPAVKIDLGELSGVPSGSPKPMYLWLPNTN